ncbi:hypothetical protein D3C87_408640 [compost metagenome]
MQVAKQFIDNLVIAGHRPAVAFTGARHGQQGLRHFFRQRGRRLAQGHEGPVRIQARRTGAAKAGYRARRDHAQFLGPHFAACHHLFEQAGAHDARIHVPGPYGVDDLLRGKAAVAQAGKIVRGIDARFAQFARGDLVAAKGVGRHGHHVLTCQVGQVMQRRRAAHDDGRADGLARRVRPWRFQGGNAAGAVAVFERHVVAAAGDGEGDRLRLHGARQARLVVVGQDETDAGNAGLQVARHVRPVLLHGVAALVGEYAYSHFRQHRVGMHWREQDRQRQYGKPAH